MTTHIQPLSWQGASSAWSRAYSELSLHGLSPENGTCPPPPGLPDVNQYSRGKQQGKLEVHYLYLTQDQILELESALENFKGYGLDGEDVNRTNFALPTLGPLLDRCAREVHYGDGIAIIRGLNPKRYSVEDISVMYLGVSRYIGEQLGIQSSKGAMISHVVDSKTWTTPKEKRHGIHTNDLLPFHTDMGAEILALQVRGCAKVGGRTCVASVRAIYNDLMQSNPLVLHTLAKPNWPIRSSTKGYILCPLLEYHGGNLIASMDPARIGAHTVNRAPALTLEQEMAIAVLQNVASKHQLKLDHQPGDMIYLNNFGLLHAREAYQDGETSSRHLVRLWLRNAALSWPVPQSMHLPWDCAFGERAKKVLNHSYPLIPMPSYIESKYNSGTAAFIPDDVEDEDEVREEVTVAAEVTHDQDQLHKDDSSTTRCFRCGCRHDED